MASSKDEGQYTHPVSECYLRFEKIHMAETFCKLIFLILGIDFGGKQIISLANFCKTLTLLCPIFLYIYDVIVLQKVANEIICF